MLPYRDSKFTFIALVVFFAIAIGYGLFEARGVVLGPTIDVPSGVSEVRQELVLIQGKASRISSLSMNGKQITVTQDGSFSEPYLLAAGDNRIVLDAKDQYGRTTEKVIEIMYAPIATSTAATSTTLNSSSTPLVAPGQ